MLCRDSLYSDIMKPVLFSIQRVNRLRQAAEKARKNAGMGWDGWSDDTHTAMELLRVFDALCLKEGFTLEAYVYSSGQNGNGVIWAVPSDAEIPSLMDCPRNEETVLRTPVPPGAIPLMQAIDGDRSPWSYLSASILGREAYEFGARWHGCWWSDQAILSKPPRPADSDDPEYGVTEPYRDAPIGEWEWLEDAPEIWEPSFIDEGETCKVILNIHNPVGQETVYQATDTYPKGSYAHQSENEDICIGLGGIVY